MITMKRKSNLLFLTLSAVFIAIIAIMCFTQIGYLKFGIVEITLISIPVAFGGALLGKWGGLLLGTAFGVSSFLQCFGFSAFGTTLFSISPFKTFLVCLVPRMLAGFLSALFFEAFSKKGKLPAAVNGLISFFIAAAVNTIGFVGLLVLFFSKTEYIQSIATQLGAGNMFMFAVLFAGVNALVEAASCTACGAALGPVAKKLKKQMGDLK